MAGAQLTDTAPWGGGGTLGDALLAPTVLYVRPVLKLIQQLPVKVQMFIMLIDACLQSTHMGGCANVALSPAWMQVGHISRSPPGFHVRCTGTGAHDRWRVPGEHPAGGAQGPADAHRPQRLGSARAVPVAAEGGRASKSAGLEVCSEEGAPAVPSPLWLADCTTNQSKSSSAWLGTQDACQHVQAGGVSVSEMFRTFNMGVGMVVVVAPEHVDAVLAAGVGAFRLGDITAGDGVQLLESL